MGGTRTASPLRMPRMRRSVRAVMKAPITGPKRPLVGEGDGAGHEAGHGAGRSRAGPGPVDRNRLVQDFMWCRPFPRAAFTRRSSSRAVGTLHLMKSSQLTTPALVVQADLLEANLATMARGCPGRACAPTSRRTSAPRWPRRQAAAGHPGFTCATIARDGGDGSRPGSATTCCWPTRWSTPRRLGALVRDGAPGHRRGRLRRRPSRPPPRPGCREVLIDVNVGLPRCGCDPRTPGALADLARAPGPRRARRDGLRGPRRRRSRTGPTRARAGGGRRMEPCWPAHGEVGRRGRLGRAAPAPTTSTTGPPRSRPAPTR